MRLASVLVALAGASWMAPGAAYAQNRVTPDLVTDRPDQTESAVVVPRGVVQLELGGAHAFDGSGADAATRLVNLGSALLRIGVAPPLELRIGFAGWHRAAPEGAPALHGFGDLDVGAKLVVAEGAGLSPAVALIGSLTIPTGHEAFRASGPDPSFRAALAHELPGDIGLGYNLGALWTTETDLAGRESLRTDLLYTLTLGRGLTDRLGGFVEGFGLLGVGDGRPSWHALDAGFTFALRANLQLDTSAGVGLSDAAEDWFVGAGLSLRIPR